MDQKDALVHNRSSPEVKIALFRSLFRGREDVYPRRFESCNTNFNLNSKSPRVYATRKHAGFYKIDALFKIR